MRALANNPARRRDVHLSRVPRELPSSRRFRRAADRRRGTDAAGRFIGTGDVERAWRHFWNAPHRANQAPLERQPEFGAPLGPITAGAGRCRGSRAGFTSADYRAIFAAARAGEQQKTLAARFGVTSACIRYHLKPSAPMRQALSAA